LEEFATSFDDADHVLVTDIYAARERNDGTLHARQVAETIAHSDARYSDGLACTAEMLVDEMVSDAVLITLGAGDSYRIGEWVLKTLRHMRNGAADTASV